MKLELNQIRTDGGTQPRGQINWGVVAEYALDMRDGVSFPSIVVFHDGRDYWLADGYHRYHATEQAGQQSIEADVRQGTQQDAQWYSYAANKSHGLRRSNEDKRRAVEAALRHPMAAALSDREIARHCGVDHKTVGAHRQKLSGEIPQIEQKSVTRNGTTYEMSTAKIGKGSEAAAFASDTTLIVGYTAPRYCGLCGHMQSIRTDEIEQRIPQICSACGEQHLRWQYNAPAPGIGPVSHSEDGRVATVTVANGDVVGGLLAVMEAEAPARPQPVIVLRCDYQLLEQVGQLNDPMLFKTGKTEGVVQLPNGLTAVPFGSVSQNLKYQSVDLIQCVPESEFLWQWAKHDDYKSGREKHWYGFRVTDRSRKTWGLTGQEIQLIPEAPDKPLEHGYAVYPCHVCEKYAIRIDSIADSACCESCGNAWDTIRDYHEERKGWAANDPIVRQLEPADNTSYPSHLECFRCGGNVLHRTVLYKAEHAAYRCYQCEAEWPSVAAMYTELVEKFRAASRRLEDIRELAKNILVY